ncbi:MAG: heparinase II/III family protein [Candidatus Ornithomonoglobus sp.]
MDYKSRLSELTKQAKDLLDNHGDEFTDGNKLAMEYLIRDAQKALAGEYCRPFNRCRGFFDPRHNEDIRFVTNRFTMTPGYGMDHYGLEPALEWFIATRETSDEVSKKNEARRKRLDNLNIKSDNLFFSNNDKDKNREEFKERIQKNEIIQKEINKIRDISNRYSSEQIDMLEAAMSEDADYAALNSKFYIWGKTDKILTFVTPKGAKFSKLRFVLPSSDNEADGLGHLWIDNIKVSPGMGDDWDIINPGFEAGTIGWDTVTVQGSPIIRAEHEKPFCGREQGSLYIENPSSDDEGGIESSEFVPVLPEVNHTIIFDAKIDGFLNCGLNVEILFYDENKLPIDSVKWSFKRKSALATVDFALTVQADAIVYFLDGDITKAEKAKKQMFFILNDFCQGIEHWLVHNSRPLGSDAYGAVQGGRILSSLAAAYTFIKDTFTKEEKERLTECIEYFVPYLMDLRDRCELSEYDAQKNAGNWQTEMAAGTGMWMMAMPEYPNAKQWLLNANHTLKSQLKYNLHSDGSWPESIRYHNVTARRFSLYAYVLKNCTGEDWFETTGLKKMFRYPIMIQTPPYRFYDNKTATPNFGDHDLDDGTQFSLMAPFCSMIYDIDSELGRMMYDTWRSAGMPFAAIANGEDVVMQNLLADYSVFDKSKADIPELKSTAEFAESGIFIMRDDTFYLALMASPSYIGHGHFDQGSFILYKNNVPIVIDPAIESYFDSTKDWYVSSSSHSTLQFARRGGKKLCADSFDICLDKSDYSALQGWNDTPRCAELVSSSFGEECDRITVKLMNTEGGVHFRSVEMDHKLKTVTITDTVEDFDDVIRVNIPLAAQKCEIDGNEINAEGYYNTPVRITFEADAASVSKEKGRCLRMFPCDGVPMMDVIRTTAKRKVVTTIR